jgi:S1-C subfamily serine protease
MSFFRRFFTRKCPQCDHSVDTAANFCRHCGWGNATSWRNCSDCGASVAADSTFCWKCNASLLNQPREQVFSDRWRREPGIFAVRVQIETPEQRLHNGIQVDDGMRGGLFRDGSLLHELGSGYHPFTSFWERLCGSRSHQFVEAILTVADPVEVVIDLGIAPAMTSDWVPVEGALLIRLQLQDLSRFQRQLLPFKDSVLREEELSRPAQARVAEIFRRVINSRNAEAIASDLNLRQSLEAELGRELPLVLEPSGLVFGGIVDLRLHGDKLDEIRQNTGSIAASEREQAWTQKKRELEQSGELARYKSEADFNETVERFAHTYNLTRMEREHLRTMRQIALQGEQKQASLRSDGENRLLEVEYEIREKRMRRNWEGEEDESDLVALARVRDMQIEAKARLDRLKAEQRDRATDDVIRRAQALEGLSPTSIIASVEETRAGSIVELVRAMQPAPGFTIQPPTPTATLASSTLGMESIAQRHMNSIGVVMLAMPNQDIVAIGTTWAVADKPQLITNAHVAQDIPAALAAGLKVYVFFSGASEPISVKDARIHPLYLSENPHHRLKAYDVAVLELGASPMLPGLPLANRQKLHGLCELQPAAYLGFPMENLAGGGTNMQRPKAIAKLGSISSLEDWSMGHVADPAQRQLIKHDLGVAGGASGSPMLDAQGEVIGIITAGNMERLYDPQTKTYRRIPSGVALNFAQRIDVLLDWMNW